MSKCPSFFEAFHANTTALRMPVSTTLFATLQTAIVSVAEMMGVLKTLGADATVGKRMGATTISAQILRHSEVLAPDSHSYLGLKANTAIRGAQ
ncbi:hypothetical protein [Burkholderia sp. BCC0044]|uniref:hypothetical protein n=1 Tax=Burkholderia sp. BCC0044 TaxID=2676295 RepID=UPI00158EB8EE|nr:hypothetical protein [Burkholderia sp. BCC0044]